jgi:ubiquinone biosynthesis protein COQ9
MATAAQLTANRANAQLSTGPLTPEGKSRVAQNALKHGLTAKHLVIRIDEAEEFAELRDGLQAELAPQGAIETITFNEVLHAAWNLHRFRRIEAEVSLGTQDDLADPQAAALLDRLTRYQARAQRAYYRALQELRTLQTNRALRLEKLDHPNDPRVPAIADINELTKQTHSEVTRQAIDMALRITHLEGSALRLQMLRRRGAEFAAVKP